jgi:Secretion system C-terminal sorting domain
MDATSSIAWGFIWIAIEYLYLLFTLITYIMKKENETRIAFFVNHDQAEGSISPHAAPRLSGLHKVFSRAMMVLAFVFCCSSLSHAALLAPDCYLEYNRCIKAGGLPSNCKPAFVDCVNSLYTYGIGFDRPLGIWGWELASVRPVVPNEDIDLSVGRYDFATESYLPGPGTVTSVTFVYVHTDDLYAAEDMSTVEWTVIGPGLYNPATNRWEITWTVPGAPAPQGYEVAAMMYDPSVPNGQHAGGFHAAPSPAGGNRLASGSAMPVSIHQGDQQAKASASATNDLGAAPQIYPVPASQQLTLQWTVPMEGVYAIVVSDMLGREVMQLLPPARLESGKTAQRFDISALPPGQYVYRIHSSTMSHTGRFLKE